MAPIGPTLPHLLSKRKREDEDDAHSESRNQSRSSSTSSGEKRRRVLGPAPPPAPLDEKPISPVMETEAREGSDSDDDFGPAPAPQSNESTSPPEVSLDIRLQNAIPEQSTKNLQRDEWMLAPRTSGDSSTKVDPTKLKSRRFNTGKGARASAQAPSELGTLWTETPEQKRQRLQDEVMGVAKPASLDQIKKQTTGTRSEAKETERKIEEYNEKYRVPSLYDQHQKSDSPAEDDPSQRAFDREKDIGGSIMTTAQRRELKSKAADFGTKFSRGSYL